MNKSALTYLAITLTTLVGCGYSPGPEVGKWNCDEGSLSSLAIQFSNERPDRKTFVAIVQANNSYRHTPIEFSGMYDLKPDGTIEYKFDKETSAEKISYLPAKYKKELPSLIRFYKEDWSTMDCQKKGARSQ